MLVNFNPDAFTSRRFDFSFLRRRYIRARTILRISFSFCAWSTRDTRRNFHSRERATSEAIRRFPPTRFILIYPAERERERRARKERAGRRKRWLEAPLQSVQLHASLTFGHRMSVAHRGPNLGEKFVKTPERCVSTRTDFLTLLRLDSLDFLSVSFAVTTCITEAGETVRKKTATIRV